MNTRDWESTIQRHLDGTASSEEVAELSGQLESDANTRKLYLQMARIHATLAADELAGTEDSTPLPAPVVLSMERSTPRYTRALLAIAAAAIVVLTASLYFLSTDDERKIVKIDGIVGTALWTGEGGRVVRNLVPGMALAGGTIEGTSPKAWIELKFKDGSKIMISGISMLTFSDTGQKELHLKSGNFSAKVTPQPEGRPLLIHTQTAIINVLGTQLEVEVAPSSTVVNVSEGKVLVKRRNDNREVEVPAMHNVIVAADRELSPMMTPGSVKGWQSQLGNGRKHTYGKWQARSENRPASLWAIPYTTEVGRIIYTVSMRVSTCGEPPVVLQPNSRIRVRGVLTGRHRKGIEFRRKRGDLIENGTISPQDAKTRIEDAMPKKMWFGLTVRHPNGDFAGRFQTTLPTASFENPQFDVTLDISDYHIDPSLNYMKSRLPDAPSGLIVKSIWCHTLSTPGGLMVTDMQLIAPVDDVDD